MEGEARNRLTAIGTLVDAMRDSVLSPPDEDALDAVEELLPEGDEFAPPYLFRTKD